MKLDSNVFYKWLYWLRSCKHVFVMPELGVDIARSKYFLSPFYLGTLPGKQALLGAPL